MVDKLSESIGADYSKMGIASPLSVRLGEHGKQVPETDKTANINLFPVDTVELSYAAKHHPTVPEAVSPPQPKGPLSEAGVYSAPPTMRVKPLLTIEEATQS